MRTTAPVRIRRNGYEYVRLPDSDLLLIDQEIQFGFPCIRGTRILAESVARHNNAGDNVAMIVIGYGVTEKQVQACLDYVNAPVKAQL